MTKKRVLIVEDQRITALDEKQALDRMGYEVISISMSGEEAVKLAERDKPDLVLMDIILASEMDGREAAKKIRELHNVPVIFVTALGDKEQSRANNFTVPEGFGYIVKPFTEEELKREVTRLMG